jgi:hypothetical protein
MFIWPHRVTPTSTSTLRYPGIETPRDGCAVTWSRALAFLVLLSEGSNVFGDWVKRKADWVNGGIRWTKNSEIFEDFGGVFVSKQAGDQAWLASCSFPNMASTSSLQGDDWAPTDLNTCPKECQIGCQNICQIECQMLDRMPERIWT